MSLWEDDDNPQTHKNFLDAVTNLTKGKHIKKPSRSEAITVADEFHLGKISEKATGVTVTDIFNVLKKSNQHVKVAKELRTSRKTKKVLNKPLEAPVADRIQRTIGYEKTKKKLSKWDSLVARNQAADSRMFPEPEDRFTNEPTQIKSKAVKSNLMLEMEVIEAKLQPTKKNSDKGDLEIDESKLTRKELIARRKEIAYAKMKFSQKAAKQRLQNKIKSKGYHRLLKRRKMIAEVKEMALLEKTDPEAVLKKLEDAEKKRVLERASLRHKNTGVWAKNLISKAQHNTDLKKDLAEQIALSRELTQKQKKDEELESEEEDTNTEKVASDPFNPWTKSGEKESGEGTDLVSAGYRKYWMERNEHKKDLDEYKEDLEKATAKKGKKKGEKKKRAKSTSEEESEPERNELQNLKNLSFKNTSLRPEFDEEMIETPAKMSATESALAALNDTSTLSTTAQPEIDPNKFAEAPEKRQTKFVNLHSSMALDYDNDEDEEMDRNQAIAAAFEDDDIVAEFEKETEGRKKEETLDLTLPGWGSWVSADTIHKPRKRLVLKFNTQTEEEAKKPKLPHVIIKEEDSKKTREHLVSDLPFPFTSVEAYEASIREPIGRTFVPETAFKLLTKPAVITKKGKIIQPIDESALIDQGSKRLTGFARNRAKANKKHKGKV